MVPMLARLTKSLKIAVITFVALYAGLVAVYSLWFEWAVWRGGFPEAAPIFVVAAPLALFGAIFGFVFAFYWTGRKIDIQS
jgi:hypothetical protein